MRKTNKKWYSQGGIQFLIVVQLLYPVAFFVNSEKALESSIFSLTLLQQLLPILLLVFILMLLANVLIQPEWVKKHLGKSSGLKGWVVASIGGILSVGPIYAWFGFLQEMIEKGMRPALVAVFLYNRSIKLPLLPLIIHYFGLLFTIILAIYMLLFSILGGMLIEKLLAGSQNAST